MCEVEDVMWRLLKKIERNEETLYLREFMVNTLIFRYYGSVSCVK